MTAGELLNHLNLKTASIGLPQLVNAVSMVYLNAAYKAFVTGIGGVYDEITINLVATEVNVILPSYVLKVKAARDADGDFVKVYNRGDTEKLETLPANGTLRYLLIGVKPGLIRVVDTPVANTTITLDVDRAPIASLVAADEASDVALRWQIDMLDYAVAHNAMLSPDPKIRAQAGAFEARFNLNVTTARRERIREKSKPTRVVAYGGL